MNVECGEILVLYIDLLSVIFESIHCLCQHNIQLCCRLKADTTDTLMRHL